MFTVYYSNQLDIQKEILIHLMQRQPLNDPLQAETILVQSPGMAQWLQWQIAEKQGIAANLQFPMPATFIWRQYAENLPDVAPQSQFEKESMTWRLMRLIPAYLSRPDFQPLRNYLASSAQAEQQKLYQLAHKIADLFDQYLVYRPEWITAWEQGDDPAVGRQIAQQLKDGNAPLFAQITRHVQWQGTLWRALTDEISAENGSDQLWHRARLHQRFLTLLAQGAPQKLPARIFVFGISALPKTYLDTLHGISAYCDVHLFFNNGCREYWGDIIDPSYWQKLQMRHRTAYADKHTRPLLSAQQAGRLANHAVEYTYDNEILQIGHPLLSSWGKLGRDFLYLLTELQCNEISAYAEPAETNLLAQIQARILNLEPNGGQPLHYSAQDHSLSFHACYSAMREVEALHDYLLHLFMQDASLTPKDIVVMVADIDHYTPYIRAVFGQEADYIPFSISDNKLAENDVLVSGFISLLNVKESQFGAEEVLALLDIPAVRARFHIETEDLALIHHWVAEAGIRFGLDKYTDSAQHNYNAWLAGLERMLLGYAMREENGIWQDSLGLDNCYGLNGRLAGYLAEFIDSLYQWRQVLAETHHVLQWHQHLLALTDAFFAADEQNGETLWYLKERIQHFTEQLQAAKFDAPLGADVVAEVLSGYLQDSPNSLKFLGGKVNFCTLLPMRSIPFKVVCLLGMNEGDYPRQHAPNSFDLMQYHHQKGDRFRRDDDRYLFLEALLSAQHYLYISYVGRSVVDDQPKEPSVLVSQLLDYVTENLTAEAPETAEKTPQAWRALLVKQHSMTAFSEQNFRGNDRTFARKWLPLAKRPPHADILDFIQPLAPEPVSEIALPDLIAFVRHPLKFFLQQRLGVSFEYDNPLIADSENFSLNNLDQYYINEQLLYCDEAAQEAFFAALMIKGIMPRGSFAQVYEKQLQRDIRELKDSVADYLTRDYHSQSVELYIHCRHGNVRLYGDLDHLYAQQNGMLQRVRWRVGSAIRDQDVIENWIYYLLQCAVQDNAAPAVYYAKKEKVTFKTVEKTTALEQLTVYVEDYLRGQCQPLPVITSAINSYLNILRIDKTSAFKAESAVDLEACVQKLDGLIAGSDYAPPDRYWQRVFARTPPDEAQIRAMNRRMQAWFALMTDSMQK